MKHRSSFRHLWLMLIEFIGTVGHSLLFYMSLVILVREARHWPMKFFGTNRTLSEIVQEIGLDFRIIFIVYTVVFLLLLSGLLDWKIRRRIRDIQIEQIFDSFKLFIHGDYAVRVPAVPGTNLTDIINDVNRLLEEFAQEVQKKKALEKNKDELITNISHDLRTPLTSILGYLGLIVNEHYQGPEEALNYASIAYKKANQMESLVSDLFEYTASTQSSYTLHYQRTHLELFLNQIVSEFTYQAEERGASIEIDVEPSSLELDIDIEKFARVYQNLIANALKYGQIMTVITLTGREFVKDQSEWVRLQVKNDGQVIPEDELELIFKRSYRADQSRTSNEAGAGLGLAITRNIIHLHGGEVYATVTDQETIFNIELPKQAEDATENAL